MAQVEIERVDVIDVARPGMSWGAIIAGWLVAVGIALVMYVAGLAMGFSALDPQNMEASAKGVGIGTGVWLVLTWVVSLFIGGMFASWFDGRDDDTSGAMHGVTVWGLSIAASGLLFALGMGGILGGGAQLAGNMAGGMAGGMHGHPMQHGTGPDRQNDATTLLQAQLMQHVRQASMAPAPMAAPASASSSMPTAVDNMPNAPMPMGAHGAGRLDPHSAEMVTAALLADHPETAKAVLAANTSMSQADVDSTVQAMSAQVDQAKSHLKAAADKAAHVTAMAMWILLISLLLSLITAALGGWLGASHVHRVYHLRKYSRSLR
jgi:hypothetical protein